MAIVNLPNGRQFAVASGVTLLDAKSSVCISLPSSHRTGRCSTFKARVQQLQTRALVTGTEFSAQGPKVKVRLSRTLQTSFEELVAEIVQEDLKTVKRDEHIKQYGYRTMGYRE